MTKYCSKCKALHKDNEICPYYIKQLKLNPQLLAEATNFSIVAAQYHLITSQTLDSGAKAVNNIVGTQLAYEGTHQLSRDIQVFRQLNVDAFNKSGVFSSAQNAKDYLVNATDGQKANLIRKLNGTGQEVDWLRWKQGHISRLLEKSKLLGEETPNAPGVDGETIFRLNKNVIKKVTVKASQSDKGLGKNISDVLEALKNDTLKPDDILAGVDGTNDALQKALHKNIEKALQNGDIDYAAKLQQAQKTLKVKEINNYKDVKNSTDRLLSKVSQAKANPAVTLQEVSKKACQGAIVGAAVGLTISGVVNYLKYKNGEITEREAFIEVGEETLKGALTGAAMGAVTIFLPGGFLGFVAGVAIGIYLNATLTNILDEVFGKGAFEAILDSSGYVYGMAVNLEDCLSHIENHQKSIQSNLQKIRKTAEKIDNNFEEFDQIMKG
jgi:hypothetical protein